MINAQTQLYGVIGKPVRHSLSPVIHNGAFQRMALNAAYLAFEVENLSAAISGIRGLGIRGVSVTIPFKTAIIPFLDQLEELDDVQRVFSNFDFSDTTLEELRSQT